MVVVLGVVRLLVVFGVVLVVLWFVGLVGGVCFGVGVGRGGVCVGGCVGVVICVVLVVWCSLCSHPQQQSVLSPARNSCSERLPESDTTVKPQRDGNPTPSTMRDGIFCFLVDKALYPANSTWFPNRMGFLQRYLRLQIWRHFLVYILGCFVDSIHSK